MLNILLMCLGAASCCGIESGKTRKSGLIEDKESGTRTDLGREHNLQIKEMSKWMSTGTQCVEYIVDVSGCCILWWDSGTNVGTSGTSLIDGDFCPNHTTDLFRMVENNHRSKLPQSVGLVGLYMKFHEEQSQFGGGPPVECN